MNLSLRTFTGERMPFHSILSTLLVLLFEASPAIPPNDPHPYLVSKSRFKKIEMEGLYGHFISKGERWCSVTSIVS